MIVWLTMIALLLGRVPWIMFSPGKGGLCICQLCEPPDPGSYCPGLFLGPLTRFQKKSEVITKESNEETDDRTRGGRPPSLAAVGAVNRQGRGAEVGRARHSVGGSCGHGELQTCGVTLQETDRAGRTSRG